MKKFKLDFTMTDNTDYDAAYLREFYGEALFAGPTAGLMKPIPGVKSTIKIPRYDAGEMIKDAGCSWSASGEGTLDEKEFSVCSKDIQLEWCETLFEANFLGELLTKGHLAGEVTPELFKTFMEEQVKKQIKQDITYILWQGDTTSQDYPTKVCDGLLKKLGADEDVITVSGTTITTSNVIAQITEVYNAIPKAVMLSGNAKIFVSDHIFRTYIQAVAAASNEAYYVGEKQGNFLGIELVRDGGLPDNYMVAANPENLVYLTDLMSDEEYLNYIPQKNISGVRSIRIAGGFKIGFGYLVSEEVVLYDPEAGS